jgi:tetraacyldisaccharide 4'-kinase
MPPSSASVGERGGRSFVERVWYDAGAFAGAARAALLPAERVFGGVVGLRDLLYDAGLLRTHELALPTVSVGNLTVGGTGKTPVAAWIASGLAARGARPAIVLRGYGGDEALVHKTLNPGATVVVGADRVSAVAEAARQGATVAVLDDAFQHRRARRDHDIVLVSADRWTKDARLLPAGPWREPLTAVRRATLVVVTRKAASEAVVDAVNERIAAIAPAIPRVSVRLAPDALVSAVDERETRPVASLAGASVRAIVGVADPDAFVKQLQGMGARVRVSSYPDHHAFSEAEIERFVSSLAGDDVAVCTLKDAVKIAPRWPRLGRPLWYVSQQVIVERGVGGVERVLDELVRSRSRPSPNAG